MIRRLAAAAAVAIAVLPAPTAAAQEDDDRPDGDQLAIVSQTAWVAPGGTYALRVRVDDAPAGAVLRWTLHRAVRNRIEFGRSLDGEGLRRLGDRVDVAVDERGADGTVDIRIPTGTVTGEQPFVSLGAEDQGVYPVAVELVDADGERLDGFVTHLVRLPAVEPDEFPLDAAVVLPLHAPPSHVAPDEVDPTRLAALDVAVDALVANEGVPLTIVPTPEALDAAVEADPAAADRIAQATAGRQVLARPWVRVDEAAWRGEGLTVQLDALRARGDDALGAVLDGPADAGTAVVPAGAGAAVTAAIDAGAERVVVPEADLVPLDTDDFPLTLTRPFALAAGSGDGTVPALMADAALAGHVGATGDPVLDAHRVLADLAVLALDAPASQRAAVLLLDDRAVATTAFLDALLQGLGDTERAGAAPLVAPVTVAQAFADVDPAADPGEGDGDGDEALVRAFADGGTGTAELGPVAADLAAAAAEVTSYRSVFGVDDPLALEVEELAATSAAGALDTTERRRLIGTGVAAMRIALDGIHGPERQQVTLTAREGQVQLILGNETGKPADVTLELRGDRLEFPGHPDNRVLVRLDQPSTRIDLQVRARSSGDAPLDLRLVSPDGRVELGRSRVTVRTTAVSGVGIVLMAAAATFLVVWWTRTILRDRREGRSRHPAHARRAPG